MSYTNIPQIFAVDNVTIEQDGATGQLQIKDLGVLTAKINTDAVTFPKINSNVLTWEYINQIELTADISGSVDSLTAYDEYLLVINVTSTGTTSRTVILTFNDDTGANYARVSENGSVQAGQSYLQLGTTTDERSVYGEIIMQGISQSDTVGRIQISCNLSDGQSVSSTVKGWWIAGNAEQLDKVAVVSSGDTLNGTINIYGRSL